MKHFDYALADFRAYLDDLNYQIEPLDDPNRMGIFHCRITRR